MNAYFNFHINLDGLLENHLVTIRNECQSMIQNRAHGLFQAAVEDAQKQSLSTLRNLNGNNDDSVNMAIRANGQLDVLENLNSALVVKRAVEKKLDELQKKRERERATNG